MEIDNRPIGVFDSGVGGLTVVREIFGQLPDEEIVYFGDTGRAPYGNMDTEEIRAFVRQICGFLVDERDVKAIVIACNTIDALCRDELTEAYDSLPIVGVIEPGCMAALTALSVGLMATQASVDSGAHEKTFRSQGGNQPFYAVACPTLAKLVEDGGMGKPEALEEVSRYVGQVLEKEVDTLILGCTHYPILIPEIEKAAGGKLRIVNPAIATAASLKNILELRGIKRDGHLKPPRHEFVLSKASDAFGTICIAMFDNYVPDISIHILG
ncbi:MAG: glutamate racemase [Defluviitaleaceae bacterium]|nr:glutamate racemase [Defluviitaleaceae bacterium]